MPRLLRTNAPVSSKPMPNSQMETESLRGSEMGCFIAKTTIAVSVDDVSRIIQTVEANPTRGTTRLPSNQKNTPKPAREHRRRRQPNHPDRGGKPNTRHDAIAQQPEKHAESRCRDHCRADSGCRFLSKCSLGPARTMFGLSFAAHDDDDTHQNERNCCGARRREMLSGENRYGHGKGRITGG